MGHPLLRTLKASAKVLTLFLSGSLFYLNPALSFVKIPIRVVNPSLQAFCSQIFPRLLFISPIFCLMLLSRFNVVLYAFCVIFVSHRFSFRKGRTMGKRSNKERINDDVTTTQAGLFFYRPVWVEGGHKMRGKRQEVRTKIYLLLECLSEKYSNNQAIRQSIIFFSS